MAREVEGGTKDDEDKVQWMLNKIFGRIGNATCLVCDRGTKKTKPPHRFLPAAVTKYEKLRFKIT